MRTSYRSKRNINRRIVLQIIGYYSNQSSDWLLFYTLVVEIIMISLYNESIYHLLYITYGLSTRYIESILFLYNVPHVFHPMKGS